MLSRYMLACRTLLSTFSTYFYFYYRSAGQELKAAQLKDTSCSFLATNYSNSWKGYAANSQYIGAAYYALTATFHTSISTDDLETRLGVHVYQE